MNPIQELVSRLNRAGMFIPLVLRLVVGYIFLRHGYQKFDQGLDGVELFFDGEGVPIPALTSRFTAVIELIGGTALIIGVASRLVAALLALVMIGAIVYVQWEAGLVGGNELEFTLLVTLLAILFIGPGRVSVDSALGIEPKESQITV